jgi:ADP-L-glycero-D-manno-heptose 6-epimerase
LYIVTGGAGFIGSAVIWRLNREGIRDILVVDRVRGADTHPNLAKRDYTELLDKAAFLDRVRADDLRGVQGLIHMGACSSTAEQNRDYLRRNNTEYTRELAEWALHRGVRFIYASSGATYGDGSRGFSDADEDTPALSPLNPYGESKHTLDRWALESGALEHMAGLKFFNVFGPNEYHKGDMASFVFKAFHQVRTEGRVRLFRSLDPAYADGEQRRDFVYVKDCVDVVWWLLNRPEANGLFNVGTGQARTWKDLVEAIAAAMGREPEIEFVDLPEVIRDGYQYHTQAEMRKLRAAGFIEPFLPLEDSVRDYIGRYLSAPDPYLERV